MDAIMWSFYKKMKTEHIHVTRYHRSLLVEEVVLVEVRAYTRHLGTDVLSYLRPAEPALC